DSFQCVFILFQLGMRQQYALGKVLRKRYMTGTNPFLDKRYHSKQVYIRSTDVNRTLISAYSNIAGMFASGVAGKDYPNETNWPTGWTPIPVHTLPEDEDHAGNVFAPCPRAVQLDEELQRSKEFKQIAQDNKDFLDYLSKNTGMTVDLRNLYQINDVHHIETLYNMSQPAWMTDEVSKRLRNLTSLVNEYTYGIGEPYVPELIRLRGGPLLRDIVDRMNHK
ncbi:Histidine acid phosphatase, partial [Trichostrongylus colubriformis]